MSHGIFDPSSLPPLDPPSSSSSLPLLSQWPPQHHPSQYMPPPLTASGLEDAIWDMTIESSYPQRPDELDCPYYMRTGHCSFGPNCKFNHPPIPRPLLENRDRVEYPDRPGQPECQYFLKTGTCKFGPSCKYHHPRDKAGTAGRVQLNILNLPLRPGEKDCQYYLKTGSCKYGLTCKFNHPPPVIPIPGFPVYPGAPSSSAQVPQVYPGLHYPPFSPSPHMPGPSNFAPILIPSPQVPVSPWNSYPVKLFLWLLISWVLDWLRFLSDQFLFSHKVPFTVPDGQQQTLPGNYVYGGAGALPQEPVAVGMFPMRLATPPSPSALGPQEEAYPERPGQPECQYYMRTGRCKYGPQCKYHHPKEISIPSSVKLYSSTGLPSRPGAPPCMFYNRFGFCKYGISCKYDHSIAPTAYPQVHVNVPVAPYSGFDYTGPESVGHPQTPVEAESEVSGRTMEERDRMISADGISRDLHQGSS